MCGNNGSGYTHDQINISKVTTMMNNDDESDNDEPSWGCLARSSSLTRIYDVSPERVVSTRHWSGGKVQLKTREDFSQNHNFLGI